MEINSLAGKVFFRAEFSCISKKNLAPIATERPEPKARTCSKSGSRAEQHASYSEKTDSAKKNTCNIE